MFGCDDAMKLGRERVEIDDGEEWCWLLNVWMTDSPHQSTSTPILVLAAHPSLGIILFPLLRLSTLPTLISALFAFQIPPLLSLSLGSSLLVSLLHPIRLDLNFFPKHDINPVPPLARQPSTTASRCMHIVPPVS